ncbi:DUF58 domain-containing protein [Halorubrum ezzemoulense]|uniref:DUF58 domain-containing protein n=1 Tax=Halorubrum ezzemoulense TaxID=337243 RepID=UPI00232D128C|nr:DUF58 domain-containing protein [Halorubrum ezzemoulense]MDB2236342.1 DUF58 domain-containing protein [Halorubrum ezzemoulense]MDB2248370.1 DUF58 domain-containing protein [Halorubrum ezzemoulense]
MSDPSSGAAASEPASTDGEATGRDGDAVGRDRDATETESADATETESAGAPSDREHRRAIETERWLGVAGAALALVGLGVLVRQSSLVLAGAVGAGYAVYARAGDASAPALAVTRTVSDEAPEPGDEVSVTVRAENVGEEALPDLRLVDGVPPGLAVVDGPARVATALRPGTAVTFEYTVRAARGDHEWEPLTAITRDAAGARERTTALDAPTAIACTPELSAGGDLPLRGLTTVHHGRVPTDVGGAGVEFHATREYRRGDPLKRIDWNRRARTGELSTVELREERSATVVLVVDARESAYVAANPDAETAVEASVAAAGQAFSALLDGGDRVGIAALSPIDCWLPPGSGTVHAARGRETLATDPALAPTPSDDRFYRSLWLRRFRRRLPADAQVLFFTPLVDETATAIARRVDAHGHLVTVLSPDPTTAETAGERLTAFERRQRLRALRAGGIRALEWGDDSFPAAVAAATRRWSR